MTTTYSLEELRDLIGPDRLPRLGSSGGRSVPAVWWITTNAEQMAAYDRWDSDYSDHREKIRALAESLGLKVVDARLFTGFGSTEFAGFNPPNRMGLRYTADAIPVPSGWRIDSKSGRLVPSRKTKADRESEANKAFKAVRKVPDADQYMTGLPTDIQLDDRSFGGTIYPVHYRRGDQCVWAYCGGDPDRAARGDVTIDDTVWHRQRLSQLIALSEQAA